MINKSDRNLRYQLNAWIVARFIEAIYNRNTLDRLPDFVAKTCRFCHEQAVIGESLDDIRIHFVYTWINQEAVFHRVEYRMEEIMTHRDIVSVKVRRSGKVKADGPVVSELSRWEMFQLHEGKIIQRWIANAS